MVNPAPPEGKPDRAAPVTLAQFIVGEMECILMEWEDFARTLLGAKDLTPVALRDHAALMLEAIAHDLRQPQTDGEGIAKSRGQGPATSGPETAATQHGEARFTSGFDLNALVSEYRALRATVTRLWTSDIAAGNREAQLARFHEAIDQALQESVLRYGEEVDRERKLFLGILGHDLRTPLGICLMAAQYLLRTEGLSDDQSKSVARIVASSRKIQHLTNDLLDIARTRLGSQMPIAPQPMNIGRTCAQVTEEASSTRPSRTITLSVEGDLAGVWDEVRMYQMLSNLVENAFHHGSAEAPVHLAAAGGGVTSVRLTVHNRGTPIPATDLRRIFEPMQQAAQSDTQTAGLGLGLYIAKTIAEAHHGSITVESSEESGTTFTVSLPRSRATP